MTYDTWEGYPYWIVEDTQTPAWLKKFLGRNSYRGPFGQVQAYRLTYKLNRQECKKQEQARKGIQQAFVVTPDMIGSLKERM